MFQAFKSDNCLSDSWKELGKTVVGINGMCLGFCGQNFWGWLLSAALSAPVVPLGSYKKVVIGTSLVVQWLRLGTASTAGDEGSIPGGGAKIQHAGQVVGLLQCW